MSRATALLALLCGAAHADPAIIRTHADAREPVPNSVAEIQIGIASNGTDAASAASVLSGQAKTLLAFLRAQPVTRLRQDAVSVEPVTVYAANAAPRVTGFAARTTLSFRAAPADMGPMLSGALANGGTEIQGLRLMPSEEATSAARTRLLAEATRDALTQAASIAEAAHLRVLGVRSVSVDQAAPPPVRMMAPMARMANAEAMPAIAAGDADLTAGVTVEVEAGP